MGNSFQEQLLKAGLVSKKQVNKVKHEQRLQTQSQRKTNTPTADEGKLRAQRQLAAKSERTRALNRQRDEEAGQKAAAAQLKQIIEQNRQPLGKGDIPYHFTDANKIKKLFVSQVMVEQLSQGRMAIVKLEGKYEVVPAALLPKIRERQAECVVAYNEAKPQGATDPDDPYAAFPIPDDYEW